MTRLFGVLAVVPMLLLGTDITWSAPDNTQVTTLKVPQLSMRTKAARVKRLEKSLKRVRGVISVAVSKKKGVVHIRHHDATERTALERAIEGVPLDTPQGP